MADTRIRQTGLASVFKARTPDEIMAVMKEEDAEAEREKILQSMTPAFRDKVAVVAQWMRTELGHALRARYELGCQVKELYEDERAGGTVYGKNAIGRL